MKKLFVVLVIALVASTGAFAEGFLIPDAVPHMAPGAFAASAGLNLGYGAFGVTGGVESIFGQINIPDVFPLSYGAAARGAFSFGYGFTAISAGLFGTLHFSWNSLNLPEWLQKFDVYAGVGLGMAITPHFHLTFGSLSGTAYHLNKNLAIIAEAIYAGWFSSSLGLQIKL